jgi:hypothetical protein
MLGSVANRHFGKLADVWERLVLLAADCPDHFYDTHAGHAVYGMVPEAGTTSCPAPTSC